MKESAKNQKPLLESCLTPYEAWRWTLTKKEIGAHWNGSPFISIRLWGFVTNWIFLDSVLQSKANGNKEWLNHLLCINRIDFGKRHLDLFYVKGEEWRYEKEWRLSTTSESSSFTRGHLFRRATWGIRSHISWLPYASRGQRADNGIGEPKLARYGNMAGGSSNEGLQNWIWTA